MEANLVEKPALCKSFAVVGVQILRAKSTPKRVTCLDINGVAVWSCCMFRQGISFCYF